MTKGTLRPQGLALATTGRFPQRKKLNYLKAACHENQASHVERKGRDMPFKSPRQDPDLPEQRPGVPTVPAVPPW